MDQQIPQISQPVVPVSNNPPKKSKTSEFVVIGCYFMVVITIAACGVYYFFFWNKSGLMTKRQTQENGVLADQQTSTSSAAQTQSVLKTKTFRDPKGVYLFQYPADSTLVTDPKNPSDITFKYRDMMVEADSEGPITDPLQVKQSLFVTSTMLKQPVVEKQIGQYTFYTITAPLSETPEIEAAYRKKLKLEEGKPITIITSRVVLPNADQPGQYYMVEVNGQFTNEADMEFYNQILASLKPGT